MKNGAVNTHALLANVQSYFTLHCSCPLKLNYACDASRFSRGVEITEDVSRRGSFNWRWDNYGVVINYSRQAPSDAVSLLRSYFRSLSLFLPFPSLPVCHLHPAAPFFLPPPTLLLLRCLRYRER